MGPIRFHRIAPKTSVVITPIIITTVPGPDRLARIYYRSAIRTWLSG